MRLTRSSMLEVLRQDYVRTARSKGLSEPAVTFVHALRNAMLPVITTIGHRDRIPVRRPDRYRNGVQHPRRRPLPGRSDPLARLPRWCRTLVMFIAIVVVLVNLIVDLAYMFVDPRIRLRA